MTQGQSTSIFGSLVVACIIAFALGATLDIQQEHDHLYQTTEITLPSDSVMLVIFKASKEAPKLEDITERYETPDSAIYESLYGSVRNAYVHELMTGRQLSFGNFISQYYYANATDSVHPWLLWYENRPEFRNE